MKYINATAVKELTKTHNKRCSVEFLDMLDRSICYKIEIACAKNGKKVTLDAESATNVGFFTK